MHDQWTGKLYYSALATSTVIIIYLKTSFLDPYLMLYDGFYEPKEKLKKKNSKLTILENYHYLTELQIFLSLWSQNDKIISRENYP